MSDYNFKRVAVSFLEQNDHPVPEKTLIDLFYVCCKLNGCDMSDKLMRAVDGQRAVESLVNDGVITVGGIAVTDKGSWKTERLYSLAPKMTERQRMIIKLYDKMKPDIQRGSYDPAAFLVQLIEDHIKIRDIFPLNTDPLGYEETQEAIKLYATTKKDGAK